MCFVVEKSQFYSQRHAECGYLASHPVITSLNVLEFFKILCLWMLSVSELTYCRIDRWKWILYRVRL